MNTRIKMKKRNSALKSDHTGTYYDFIINKCKLNERGYRYGRKLRTMRFAINLANDWSSVVILDN